MSFEGFKNKTEQSEPKKESPKRLSFALETMMRFAVSKVEVKGEENLNKIPEGKRVIIACSHISDIDIPVAAYALRHNFDLLMTNQSTQTLFKEPNVYTSIRLAGKDNFIPIDYAKIGKEKFAKFNPNNFIEMKESLDKSQKTPLLAAHNPSKNWQLGKGGYGAVLLSQYEGDAVILPVAVNIKSEQPIGMAGTELKTAKEKPEAEVVIGEPFELPPIEGISDLVEIFNKRKRGEELLDADRERFSALHKALGEESDMIMKKIAQYLPEEKRGAYGKIEEE